MILCYYIMLSYNNKVPSYNETSHHKAVMAFHTSGFIRDCDKSTFTSSISADPFFSSSHTGAAHQFSNSFLKKTNDLALLFTLISIGCKRKNCAIRWHGDVNKSPSREFCRNSSVICSRKQRSPRHADQVANHNHL